VTPAERAGVELASRSFERILLIKPSSLGDIVHALPVLHGLRGRYPHARIDWLIGSAFAPLLEGDAAVDELVIFDRRRFGRIGRSGGATVAFVRFVRELRARRYELVIDLQGLFRTGFLARASGAAVRVGFADAREGAWVFYTHRLQPTDPDAHAVDRNYLVAGLFGFADTPIEFKLSLDEAVRADAARLHRESGVTDEATVVAVVPGARWETKVWLPERFGEMIDTLQSDAKVRCVLLGGADEVELCARIAGCCRSKPVNLAGRTTLRQLAAVLERADVVLCHDSAAMHLATALGRPLVCLVGPTNPLLTGPYRRPEDVVRVPLSCSPCYLRKLSKCGYDHRCMRDLSTSMVVDAVCNALDKNRRRINAAVV
jgi:lipopolysaccharide heptosyltransferase I